MTFFLENKNRYFESQWGAKQNCTFIVQTKHLIFSSVFCRKSYRFGTARVGV